MLLAGDWGEDLKLRGVRPVENVELQKTGNLRCDSGWPATFNVLDSRSLILDTPVKTLTERESR